MDEITGFLCVRMAKLKFRPKCNFEFMAKVEHFQSNLTEFQLVCKEDWANFSVKGVGMLHSYYPKDVHHISQIYISN